MIDRKLFGNSVSADYGSGVAGIRDVNRLVLVDETHVGSAPSHGYSVVVAAPYLHELLLTLVGQ